MSFLFRSLAALTLAAAMAGCATVSPDAGRADVEAMARERIGADARLPGADRAVAARLTRDLLAQPLTADVAVQIALLNNPTLEMRLADLGIGAADVAQAGRLPNPRFAFGNRRSADVTTIDRAVMVSVLGLLTLPLASEVAQRQYTASKLAIAGDVLRLAHDTRRAWVEAVAAQEIARYRERIVTAADAARDLAQRMEKAGNFSVLARMREEAFAMEAEAALKDARLAAALQRETLVRYLGLEDQDRVLSLPARLPDLPARAIDAADVARALPEQRLDVQAAKHANDAIASRVGLTRATRFVNVLEVGYINESQTGERRQNGYEIEIEVPLFDWGDARLARAEAEYMQSVAQLRAVALTARSEVRASYAAYRARHDLARHHRQALVPLRLRMADETLLRYNAMLIGVFELLAEARAQIESVTASIAAQRDFWIADADLAMALSGVSFAADAPRRTAASGPPRATGGH